MIDEVVLEGDKLDIISLNLDLGMVLSAYIDRPGEVQSPVVYPSQVTDQEVVPSILQLEMVTRLLALLPRTIC